MAQQLDLTTNWLRRRHPAYKRMAEHWQFLLDSYDGGPAWFNKENLPKYPSELEEKYKHRLATATRNNHTADVIDTHTGYIFKVKSTRQGPAHLEAFWQKPKREEGDIDDLMAEVCTKTANTGRVAVVIDKLPGVALSKADEKAPYAYTVGVLDILDYAKDKQGRLLWILTRENERDDANPKTSSGECKERYRLRTPEGWELWEEKDGAPFLIEEGKWGFGAPRVPVVLVDHQDSDREYDPPGLVDDIARLDRLIAQEQSSLHEIVVAQGAPTLTYPGEVESPLTLGVSSVITYDPNAPTPPGFMAIPGELIAVLQDRIEKLIDRLREKACLPTKKTNQAESGEAKKWDSQELQAKLTAKAQNLQAAEMEIAAIVDLFHGGDGKPEVSIRYPSTFDVTTLEQDVQQAAVLNEMPGQYSPTYRVQLAKAIARKSLPDLDDKTQELIDREIEANVTAGDVLPDDDEVDREGNEE